MCFTISICTFRRRTANLYDTVISTGIKKSQWLVRDPLTFSLTCLFGSGDCPVSDLTSVVVHHDQHISTTLIARMQRAWTALQVAYQGGDPVGFHEFMYRILKQHVRKSSLTGAGLVLLGSFKPQAALKQKLHASFKYVGLVGAADQLSRTLYSIEIARMDRTIPLETPEGYGVRRAGGPMELFSNFIIRLEGNVTFGEKAALNHRASVLIGDVQEDLILPSRLLDSPRDLQEHVQMLLAARKSLLVPALRDPSAFKQVAFYLRGPLPRLPTSIVLPFLGSIIRGQRVERQQAIQTPIPGPCMSTLQTTRSCAKMSDRELIKEHLSTMQSSLFIVVFK